MKVKVETVKVETEKFCFTAVRIKDKAFFNFLANYSIALYRRF